MPYRYNETLNVTMTKVDVLDALFERFMLLNIVRNVRGSIDNTSVGRKPVHYLSSEYIHIGI